MMNIERLLTDLAQPGSQKEVLYVRVQPAVSDKLHELSSLHNVSISKIVDKVLTVALTE